MEVYKDGVMGWEEHVRNGTEFENVWTPIMTITPVDPGHLWRM